MNGTDHETPPALKIAIVTAVFAFRGTAERFDTDSSAYLFRRLETAANLRQHVEELAIGGKPLDRDSLGALNAYLRTPRALNHNGVLPFNRLRLTRSRWDWEMFSAYLNLTTEKAA